MKRKLWSMAAALVLMLVLTIPAQAATEYGLIYDETEVLYSEELKTLGTETMRSFLENYGYDLRVDILVGLGEFGSIEDTAEYLYKEYGYGGDGKNGASLTLLVHEDENGVALDDWCTYFGGDDEFWTTNGPWNVYEVQDILAEENWAGDLNQDIETLTKAISAMVEGLESFILAGGTGEVDGEATPEVPTTGTGETAEGTAQLDSITDAAGLLTSEEWQALEGKAREISAQYGVGVYAVMVNDYRDYAATNDIFDASDEIYHGYSLGLGEEGNGIILLLSMAERDYSLLAYGNYAQYAFNQEGLDYLEDYFLDDFGSDSWYAGFAEYLNWCADYLAQAESGTPYSSENIPFSDEERSAAIMMKVAVILIVPLIVAGIYILILSSKMKSVAKAVEASTYMAGNLHLTENRDIYSHTTETRRKIEKNDNNSSGGRSSGGGSGRKGKF